MFNEKERLLDIMTKNAFITIVGRPNVGKSSLLNKIIGEKIAAVSAKPQTTRTKIVGVLTKEETQYVFIDTPGMHKAKNKLSEHMVKSINESVSDVDIVCFMVDVTKELNEAERGLIESFKNKKSHVILVLNKIDLLPSKEKLLPKIAEISQMHDFTAVIPCSVLQEEGIDILMKEIEDKAIEGPHFFPDDMLTDQPEKVIAAEIIREKLLNLLSDEIPHGIAVVIEKMREREDKDILDIEAEIFCEKESHKGMVIGKGGAVLKKVGQLAREDMEEFFQIKISLKLWVKVKEGWRNREGVIRNFGLNN